MPRVRGKKTKGGKKNKSRNAKKRIKKFKAKGLYEVDEKGRILRKDRAYRDGKRIG